MNTKDTHEYMKRHIEHKHNVTGNTFALFYADGRHNPNCSGYFVVNVETGEYRKMILNSDMVRIHITK